MLLEPTARQYTSQIMQEALERISGILQIAFVVLDIKAFVMVHRLDGIEIHGFQLPHPRQEILIGTIDDRRMKPFHQRGI